MRASAAQLEPNAITAAQVNNWQIALPSILTAVLGTLLFYRDTVTAMWTIWARSDTYAHCFLVPLVSIWLLWRERKHLNALAPSPSWSMLLAVAIAGFAWLIGTLSAVNALSQFSLVAIVVLTVAAVLGVEVTRTLAFPLFFLFFAVPFGDFLLPRLMDWTAEFTILALRATGVPVYREGLNFSIPSGNWSVVEACSGVRYLIASVMAGTLYSYLNYRSLRRRLLFIGVSFVVPIVANWLRAYLIVLVGHLSNNQMAAGVDHLVYGWMFFGVVMITLYWVGARWREDADDRMAPIAPGTMTLAPTPQMRPLIAVTVAALAVSATWPGFNRALEQTNARRVAVASITSPQGWQAIDGGLTDWQPDFHGQASSVHQTFRRGDAAVSVYVGYYHNQTLDRKLVTSTNNLIVSDHKRWARTHSGSRDAEIGSASVNVRTTKLLSRSGEQLLAWHWYWINGRLTSSDIWAKAYTAWSRLTGQGDDSAVIIVYARANPGDESLLGAFLQTAAPAIEATLQTARAQR